MTLECECPICGKGPFSGHIYELLVFRVGLHCLLRHPYTDVPEDPPKTYVLGDDSSLVKGGWWLCGRERWLPAEDSETPPWREENPDSGQRESDV